MALKQSNKINIKAIKEVVARLRETFLERKAIFNEFGFDCVLEHLFMRHLGLPKDYVGLNFSLNSTCSAVTANIKLDDGDVTIRVDREYIKATRVTCKINKVINC